MKKFSELIHLINKDLWLFLKISFAVFLFILFFQPFHLEFIDFNNRMLIFAGMASIVLITLILIRIFFPWIIRKENYEAEPVVLDFLGGLLIVIISSVSLTFYIRYVGQVELTFYMVFKVALISMIAPVILRIFDIISELKQQNESLIRHRKLQKSDDQETEYDLKKIISFTSENNTETLNLRMGDIAVIRSADNYVEIIYRESDKFNKKLLRTTLRTTEQQLNVFPNFIRCHRMSIVNIFFIEKLEKTYNSSWIVIKDFNEKIPVSRPYLLKVKEYI